MERFKTVLNMGQSEIIEKKSRFIGHAQHVETEDEARSFIDSIKKEYWDARHNAFAYQLGGRISLQRFSDDGEPQGTAGSPILNVLTCEDIRDCVIVVTRYFGGTLLGTGGLVRAYGKCAKEALHAAGIAEIQYFTEYGFSCDYSLMGKIQHALAQDGFMAPDISFGAAVEFRVLSGDGQADRLMRLTADLTYGRATVKEIRRFRGAVKDGHVLEI